MTVKSFHVDGRSYPGGSKTIGYGKKTGKAYLRDAGGENLYQWKKDVRAEAALHFDEPIAGAVAVVVYFYRRRPKHHYRTGKHARELKKNAPRYPTQRPDTTKLWRSVEDALTGIAWHDDAVVVKQTCEKVYADRFGMDIHIEALD